MITTAASRIRQHIKSPCTFRLSSHLQAKMSAPTFWRTSAHLSRRLIAAKQPYRCLSCSVRLAQELAQEQAKQDAKTTHFGFENVPESEKESRGAILTPQSPYTPIANLIVPSRCSLLLRRLLLRHNERPNVPLHPPPLERPLRSLPEPWPTPHHLIPPKLQTYTPNHSRHSRRNRRHRVPHALPRQHYKQRPHFPRHRLGHQPCYAI